VPEWRAHPRLDFGIKVMNKDTSEIGMMRDISVGGCFIHKSKGFNLLPINARLPLSFEIPGEDEYEDVYIEVEGKVVHHGKAGEGMGINFMVIESSVANVINGFVKAFL
jgi:hypothetical protein